MNLDTAARQPFGGGSGGRFYLISYLPTYAAALFLLLLVWAGAPTWHGRPGRRIRFSNASHMRCVVGPPSAPKAHEHRINVRDAIPGDIPVL